MNQEAIHEVRAAYHQVFLSPEDAWPDLRSDWRPGWVVEVDGDQGLILCTGCSHGPVEVSVRALDFVPADGLDVAISGGWEVGEERDCEIAEALFLTSPDPDGPPIEVFRPASPGLFRIRVLARGRAGDADQYVATPTERFEVTLWNVDAARPLERVGGDGV
ncbi:MAG TPA: hypothetical protein VGL04_09330 [Sporichthyaceae bacterium]